MFEFRTVVLHLILGSDKHFDNEKMSTHQEYPNYRQKINYMGFMKNIYTKDKIGLFGDTLVVTPGLKNNGLELRV
jgi:hypothetical protein